MAIPTLLSFGIVFLLISMMSPQGQTLHLFQQGIFLWNHDHLSRHMDSLQFSYKIKPTSNPTLSTKDGYQLPHSSEELWDEPILGLFSTSHDPMGAFEAFQADVD